MTKLRNVLCLVLLIVTGVWLFFPKSHKFDADAILAQSELRGKTFASEVKEINADGMSAYLLEEHSNPIVAVSFMFKRSGAAYVADEELGLTTLLADMLTNGAGEYDALQFKDIGEEYGVRLGFGASDDAISGFVMMPTANKDMAVKLLTSALYQPHFAGEYMDLTKKQMLTAIRKRKENPESVLADKFAEIIYAGHPYARQSFGNENTVPNLSAEALRSFMHKHLTKQNIIIGIAGDITEREAQKLIIAMFGQLPAQFAEEELSQVAINSSGKLHYIDRDSPQAITAFTVRGTKRNNADFYPLYIANYIFGGSGLNSRISKVIREEKGLTYGIYTYLSFSDYADLLGGGYSSTPDNFEEARSLLLQEWQKIAAGDVTAAELQQAKDSMIAAHNLRFASIGGIADMLVAMQQYDLGRDFLEKRNEYVDAVTLEQVNEVAKKYFEASPDFVIIGAQETLKTEDK